MIIKIFIIPKKKNFFLRFGTLVILLNINFGQSDRTISLD